MLLCAPAPIPCGPGTVYHIPCTLHRVPFTNPRLTRRPAAPLSSDSPPPHALRHTWPPSWPHAQVLLALAFLPFCRVADVWGLQLTGGEALLPTGQPQAVNLGVGDQQVDLEATSAAAAPIRSTTLEEALLVGYVGACLALWAVGLGLWERAGYVGSFEWAVPRLLGHASLLPTAPASGPRVAAEHGSWADWSRVFLLTASLSWGPPMLWGLACTQLAAPAMDDVYLNAGAAQLLWTPTTPRRPKLSLILLAVTYVLPAGLSLAVLAHEAWHAPPHSPKQKQG